MSKLSLNEILNELFPVIGGASVSNYFINESNFPTNIDGNDLKVAKATLSQLGYTVSSEYLYSKASNRIIIFKNVSW